MQPKSGYKTITPIQIGNVMWANQTDALSLKGVRVYFACFSLLAIREAANRSHNQSSKKDRGAIPSYRVKELARLTGLAEKVIKKELSRLHILGLLSFSESEILISKSSLPESDELISDLSGSRSSRRPIPVPRSIFRLLSRTAKEATMKTLIAYIARGLCISRSGEITGKGSVKCSWIASVMGLSLRSVKSARKELIDLKIITNDTASHQWKLNKTGAYFTINLDWTEAILARETAEAKIAQAEVINPVDNSFLPESEFAPLPTQKVHNFAPPYKDKKTSSKEEYKYQKSLTTSRLKPSGVSTERVGKEKPPTIKNITVEDFQSFYRTEELYHQAIKAGWLNDSENNFLNWVAAAVRAKTQKDGDPVRIFVGIVKKKLFFHITQAEEERARLAIRKFRYSVELPEDIKQLVA